MPQSGKLSGKLSLNTNRKSDKIQHIHIHIFMVQKTVTNISTYFWQVINRNNKYLISIPLHWSLSRNVSAFGCVFLAEVNALKAHVGIFQVAWILRRIGAESCVLFFDCSRVKCGEDLMCFFAVLIEVPFKFVPSSPLFVVKTFVRHCIKTKVRGAYTGSRARL